jgi:hypothetical protein
MEKNSKVDSLGNETTIVATHFKRAPRTGAEKVFKGYREAGSLDEFIKDIFSHKI